MSSRPPVTMARPNSSPSLRQSAHGKSVLELTPTAPTVSLPPLGKLATHSTEHVKQALSNLYTLYFPSRVPSTVLNSSNLTIPNRKIQHSIHDTSVPDSGYASAEEDEDEDADCMHPANSDEENDIDAEIDILRADPLERAFAIKWLTGFVTRSDVWLNAGDPEETEQRSDILDEATSLLAAFSGHDGDEEDVALTRTFSFPLTSSIWGHDPGARAPPKHIHVELNDAPLSKDDHTSVGLQSWGSSILLAERFCTQPSFFSLSPSSVTLAVPDDELKPLRILELGAGTGMLSIVAAKILALSPNSEAETVATDYHPDVLDNLSQNVETNFPSPPSSSSRHRRPPVRVMPLDWEHPVLSSPLDEPFDIILAADVIYHPCHAQWIKRCVEQLLSAQGVFWLIIPLRTTGRHEGMDATVEGLFPDVSASSSFSGTQLKGAEEGKMSEEGRELAVLYREEVGRQGNVGRADEGGYKLFKIGWVNIN
ncbi:putative methyltransferase-domain-containing protein [Gymnopilus junonius]|uniref:Methyltransferase-domain-containing protein n=1 Tax=Gymnopilus junonius TaxID=109634 RepID=A0A9P5TKN0_GYMJU|nr:putative methyltransferase-domain-containing protein [Gymnopilus junonius]